MTDSAGVDASGSANASPAARPLDPQSARGRRAILLVESNPILRDYLQRLLRTGFPHANLIAVAGERDAYSRVARDPPDFILVNLRPGSGRAFSVIGRLRRMVAGAKLAVLSGLDLPEYREEALRCGAHHYLEKTSVRSEDIIGLLRAADGPDAAL